MIHFRNDINGLRGIAVLAVVLFHFQINGIKSGFIGVDVFFVISGYLMTAIIFGGIKQDRFSLLKFYLNRGRRIIPALAFLCLVLLIYGWFYTLPVDYETIGKHAASSLGFFSNIIYWQEAGYFDTSAYSKWLLHTWSLSVEWQFYILYPILILVLRKRINVSFISKVLVVFTLLSLCASVYVSKYWPSAAFYLFPTRAWEMLMGGLVYLFPVSIRSRNQIILETLGLILIVLSAVCFSADTVWPGWLALTPVLGTAFVIAANKNDSKITNNFIIQWIGINSYSIYLWHWPIVVLLNNTDHFNQPIWKMLGIVLSFILGYLSCSLIERNTRRADKVNLTSQLQLIQIVSFLIPATIIGTSVYFSKGVNNDLRVHMTEKDNFIEKYKKLHANVEIPYHLECDFNNSKNQLTKKIAQNCTSQRTKGSVFLWGDSTTQALSAGLRNLLSDKKINQVATSACPPSIKESFSQEINTNQYYCDIANHYALQKIKELKPDIVISSCASCHDKTNWQLIANRLHSLGVKHFILVGPGPGWAMPELIVKKYWHEKIADITPIATQNEHAFILENKLKKTYKNSKSVEYISMIDTVCTGKICVNFVPNTNELISLDGSSHLTPAGSVYMVKKMLGEKLTT